MIKTSATVLPDIEAITFCVNVSDGAATPNTS
jgi:hypothetical protein